MMEKSKVVELLETIPFFAEFNAKEKDYVAGLEAQVLRFRPADIIIKEGDIDKAFYVVLKGAVFVSKRNRTMWCWQNCGRAPCLEKSLTWEKSAHHLCDRRRGCDRLENQLERNRYAGPDGAKQDQRSIDRHSRRSFEHHERSGQTFRLDLPVYQLPPISS